jgi:uncharacterized protein (TIGR00269 family)
MLFAAFWAGQVACPAGGPAVTAASTTLNSFGHPVLSEETMRCDRCKSEAIIYQQYSGLHLCGQHVAASVEAKAKRAIRTRRWMEPDDHIAVALSGNASSSALLWFLKNLTAARRDITLSAITVDEGIQGCSAPPRAAAVAASLCVPCTVASFRDEFGTGMDGIAAQKGDAVLRQYRHVLRRFLLDRIARRQGITKLALGLTLDDEAQAVLMNMLRGRAERLLVPHRDVPGMVPVIRPFMGVPEREVGMYACMHLGGSVPDPCPAVSDAMADDVREVLAVYTLRHPSTTHSLARIGERLATLGGRAGAGIRTCERCGEPCSGTCEHCRIIQEVCRGGT